MQITAPIMTSHTSLIAALYTDVDAMNPPGVVSHVTENVTFRLGNFGTLVGRHAVEDANASFFATIAAMRHTISDIWSSGDTAFCRGTVQYTRKDLSEHEVPFATLLQIRDGAVADYQVFVDISGL